MSVKDTILVRSLLASSLMVLAALAIIIRIFDIQFIDGDKWRDVVQKSYVRLREVKANRGDILADDGSLIATSLPFYRVAFDPTVSSEDLFKNKIDSLGTLLHNFFGSISSKEYNDRLRTAREAGNKYVLLSNKNINYKEKKLLENWPIFRKGQQVGGVIFEKKDLRYKPFGSLGRRAIGLTQEDDSLGIRGTTGIEYSYDDMLKGKNGKALYQKLSGSQWKPISSGSQARPESGLDIHTTLNIDMQQYAASTLEAALIQHKAAYGCVLLIEVQTGAIKVMVNLGRDREGKYVENYNYAVASQGVTEPGSTFKAVSMMAALENGKVTLDDSIDTGAGSYMFYEECVMRDITGFGKITVRQAFEKSSNIGISRLIYDRFNQDPQKFLTYIQKFKLSKSFDFQIKGLGKPFINQVNSSGGWSGCSLPWMSIGYELELSPLQTLTFYNAIANNGKMIIPFIVKKVSKNQLEVESFGTKIMKKNICSDKTLKIIQSLLEGTVKRGTARNICSNTYKIAGKTGTTHKLKNGAYTNQYYTSFVGYFPADRPRYSCIVVVDDPKGKAHFGGNVAAPVFKEIADNIYIKYIHSDFNQISNNPKNTSFPHIIAGNFNELQMLCDKFSLPHISMNTTFWVRTKIVNDTIQWVNNLYTEPHVITDVRGMTLKDALYILESRGLKVTVKGQGRVKTQSLPPGTKATKKGRKIMITLG